MEQTICIFGDSIVWGSDDPVGGWATRLRISLFAEFGAEVYPLGVTGNTTTDLLQRFDLEAAAREPDVVIFAIGINDSIFSDDPNDTWVPVAQFEKNISELVTRARAHTDKIFFVGLTPIDDLKTNPMPWAAPYCCSDSVVSNYNDALRGVCAANSVEYISIDGLVSLAELSDGVHPNGVGHEKIYKRMREVLIKKLYAVA